MFMHLGLQLFLFLTEILNAGKGPYLVVASVMDGSISSFTNSNKEIMNDDNGYDDDDELGLGSIPSVIDICSSLEQIIQNSTGYPESKEMKNKRKFTVKKTIDTEVIKNAKQENGSNIDTSCSDRKYERKNEVQSGVKSQDLPGKIGETDSKENHNICSQNCQEQSGLQYKNTAETQDMAPEEKPPFPLACKICHETILNENDINKHYIIHGKELQYFQLTGRLPSKGALESCPLFFCQICNKSFLYKNNLDSHYRVHGVPRTLRCSTCNEVFTMLDRNIQVLGSEKLQCSMCVQTEKYIKSMAFEKGAFGLQQVQYNASLFQSPVRKQGFYRKSHLNAHQKALGHKEAFRCIICGKSFSERQKLKWHYAKHKWHKCPKCNCMCITKDDLEIHYKDAHDN